jgi:hypothetical protein
MAPLRCLMCRLDGFFLYFFLVVEDRLLRVGRVLRKGTHLLCLRAVVFDCELNSQEMRECVKISGAMEEMAAL